MGEGSVGEMRVFHGFTWSWGLSLLREARNRGELERSLSFSLTASLLLGMRIQELELSGGC